MFKKYREEDVRFTLDNNYKWVCIDTDVFNGLLVDYLHLLGIDYIPDECEFARFRFDNYTVHYRAYGGVICVTKYS